MKSEAGHGDFGGEVERVLGMVDGVCLLVDANEGPMTQTKFVLKKALQFGLRPIVVLNKMDRPNARADETETALFDLFTSLNATDDQLAYPTLYASAKEGLLFFLLFYFISIKFVKGWAVRSMDDDKELGIAPLLDAVVEHIPPPTVSPGPFSMLYVINTCPYITIAFCVYFCIIESPISKVTNIWVALSQVVSSQELSRLEITFTA